MILAFELTWSGAAHAPINAAMVQIAALGFPEHEIRVHADATHLDMLFGDRGVAALPRVRRVAVRPSLRHQFKTHVVSARRFAREFAIISGALRRVPRGEPCLVLLLSATSTAIWAAAIAARLHGAAGVQAALHGNLNDAFGWRPRNPVARAFDLGATLRARLPAPVRFIVFEQHIRDALARVAPLAAARTDVVPHPVNPGDLPADFNEHPRLGDPIRIGFVGQATRAKGIDVFLEVAARVKALHPGRVAFHLIGSVRPGEADAAAYGVLDEAPDGDTLSRESFTAALARLDYVLLPFRAGYYDFSASGGLIDAVTWLKPVIATRVPLTEAFAAAYGDIGFLATDADALAGLVASVVAAPDSARYAAQVGALRRARDRRMPAALAGSYRTMVIAGFTALRLRDVRTDDAFGPDTFAKNVKRSA